MIKVRVPATSANVGCGYDCVGVALSLYTTFTFEEQESGLSWEGCEAQFANEDNLIYTSFVETLKYLKKTVSGVKIGIDSHVPVSRGLGSSATCVVGGIFGAYALTNTPIDKATILDIATRIEGHPDNVAPAIYGGLRASCMLKEQGKAISVSYDIDDRFLFEALIPDFETETKEARKVIPQQIAHVDAVYSSSRLAVVLKAFEQYDLQVLRQCMDDKLHEPYRKSIIDEYDDVKHICQSIDSVCFLISGSGSTLLNVLEAKSSEAEIQKQLKSLKHHWQSIILSVDQEGAVILC